MVPCPEAFVVLIAAISLGRVLLGLALLTAFSLGLATVLIAIGIAMVMAGPAMRKVAGDGPWIRRLPVLSALVVTVIGLALIVQASRAL
jgi:ABC-type nickel/cobalt efflux system permease component RcnA